MSQNFYFSHFLFSSGDFDVKKNVKRLLVNSALLEQKTLTYGALLCVYWLVIMPKVNTQVDDI